MRLTKSLAAAALVVAAAAPAADAAPKKAKLKVSKVSNPPRSITAGDDFRFRTTVANRGRRAGRGVLTVTLTDGTASYAIPRRIGRVATGRVRAKGTKRFTLRLTVPAATGAAEYRLRTCVKQKGRRKRSCRSTRRLTVTAPATPTPTPTATPTASATATATPAPVPATEQLRDAITGDALFGHLRAFQGIADDNGGNRAAGLPGYAASLQYVKGKLQDAGYETATQTFSFVAYEENAPSVVEQTAPTAKTIESNTLDYSPSGDVTGAIQTATPDFTPPRGGDDGCEDEDFEGKDFDGKVALIQRGTCNVVDKAVNAKEAGAVAMILFNAGDSDAPDRNGLPAVTLGEDPGIPVVGVSYADGEALGTTPGAVVHVTTDTTLTPTTTSNLIAETAGGAADHVVLVGAHLDSVGEGPGINDNGTGSAATLEIALQMAQKDLKPKNKVRFAWWGAEEAGLVGSDHYVAQLTEEEALNIALNLNFDMLGSPNYARFVYDGDGSAFGDVGPAYSDQIEKDFTDYFAGQGLATEETAFDGRSDYFGFINVGIPAGGLFSGAEDEKSQDQAEIFGGIPDTPFDPNYHEAGDTIRNVSRTGLVEMSQAAAHVTGLQAFDRDLPTPELGRAAARGAASGADYRGHRAIR